MKKKGQNTIDKFIDENIEKILFNEVESTDVLGNMEDYFAAEEKRTKTEIDTDNRLKSAQINPDERKIKDTNIKKNKERLAKIQQMKKDVEAQKKQSEAKAKVTTTASVTAGAGVTGIAENMAAPIIRRSFAEQIAPVAPGPIVPAKPKKVVRVIFDKSTKSPFNVDFTERGFLVDGTRMSFEALETALAKEFNIVLNQGNGLVLDQVKMQKILKYKDRF